jgi:hypothetical protein
VDRRLGPRRWCFGRGAPIERRRSLPIRGECAAHIASRGTRSRRGAFARSLRSGVGPEEARKLREVVERVQGNG